MAKDEYTQTVLKSLNNRSKVTKDEYIQIVLKSLDNLTEAKAMELFSFGTIQDFIDDNDIFDAIHMYLGSLEVPVSDDEYQESIDAIRKLIDDYEKEKRDGAKTISQGC